ncbi:MAG: hypothetical protein Q8Q50_03445 [Methylobacter sp.]|nr:hypothetical protein [Methylobacter sp.]
MQLAPVIARIDAQLPTLKLVTAAATVPLAITALKVYPSACVVMPRGSASGNNLLNGVSQQVKDEFLVVLACRNVTDMRGLAAMAEMDALRPLLNAALLNWVPAAAYDPIEYAGYQMVASQDGLLFWADHFTSRHFVRSV